MQAEEVRTTAGDAVLAIEEIARGLATRELVTGTETIAATTRSAKTIDSVTEKKLRDTGDLIEAKTVIGTLDVRVTKPELQKIIRSRQVSLIQVKSLAKRFNPKGNQEIETRKTSGLIETESLIRVLKSTVIEVPTEIAKGLHLSAGIVMTTVKMAMVLEEATAETSFRRSQFTTRRRLREIWEDLGLLARTTSLRLTKENLAERVASEEPTEMELVSIRNTMTMTLRQVTYNEGTQRPEKVVRSIEINK